MSAAPEGAPILVTGAAGFVGSWLVPELVRGGAHVVGARKPGLPWPELDCEWAEVDLRDRAAVRALVERERPKAIVHLAAVAAPREAARDPLETLRMNYGALAHVLDAVAEFASSARVLYVSTGEVYGWRGHGARASCESDPLVPSSVYAASKAAAEQLARLAVTRQGLDVVIARPFNHTGRGRPPIYAESNFARQIVAIETGAHEAVLRVGNLEPERDFSDVRDVVAAYALLLDRAETGGIYNVCSGRARSIGSVLKALIAQSTVEPRVEVDADLYVESDPDALASVGDPSRIQALGWQPAFQFEQTLGELLEGWRVQS